MTEGLEWRRRKIAEDEISAVWQTYAEIENAEQAKWAVDSTNGDDFWPAIRRIAAQCDDILRQHGLPCPTDWIEYDGEGRWWSPSEDVTEIAQRRRAMFCNGRHFVRQNYPDLSDPWYASEIGFKCHLALCHAADMTASNAHLLTLMYYIGALRKDWHWRKMFKAEVVRGRKTRASAKVGGETRARQFEEERTRILAEISRHLGNGKSLSRAAELTANAGFGTSKAANLKLWNRHKK